MKTHTQIVAGLHIALGSVVLLLALVLFSIMGTVSGFAISHGAHGPGGLIAFIATVVFAILVILALPGIVGGWALYTGRPWGRPIILVLGFLHLIHPPFGTAIGIYTIWALLYVPPATAAPVVNYPST